MQTAMKKAIRLGRATMLAIGVGVSFALAPGLATVALAAVPGDPFKLGKTNAVNAISSMVGSVAGPSLKIDNNSAASGATALDLQVQPTKDPMKVNSSAKVDDLNSDELDGKNSTAFLPNRTYEKTDPAVTAGAGETGFARADCDPGDLALSGGYNFGPNDSFSTVVSMGASGRSFGVGFKGPRTVVPIVTCADFPPLR